MERIMNTSTAQMVVLATYGNHFFQTGVLYGSFFENIVFGFCKSVTFAELRESEHGVLEQPYAQSPQAWFEKLRADGVHGLRLHYESDQGSPLDRNLSAFVGGGGRWLLEAVRHSSSDYWMARWQTGEEMEPDNRIWIVTYFQVESEVPSAQGKAESLQTIIEDLTQLLQDLIAFSEKQQLTGWAGCFRQAIEVMNDPAPSTKAYHSDIFPPEYHNHEAQALIAAAQTAWVFGGMGSWNDLAFDGDDQNIYDALSDRLYDLLNMAIVQATNTSFDDQ